MAQSCIIDFQLNGLAQHWKYQLWFDTIALAFSMFENCSQSDRFMAMDQSGKLHTANGLTISLLTATRNFHFKTSLTFLQPQNTFPLDGWLCHLDHIERRKVYKCHGLFLISFYWDIRWVYMVAMRYYVASGILRLSLEVRVQERLSSESIALASNLSVFSRLAGQLRCVVYEV